MVEVFCLIFYVYDHPFLVGIFCRIEFLSRHIIVQWEGLIHNANLKYILFGLLWTQCDYI